MSAEGDLLSAAELADCFGVTVRTIHRWCKDGIGPPHTKVGKSIVFRRDEVESWFADQRVGVA